MAYGRIAASGRRRCRAILLAGTAVLFQAGAAETQQLGRFTRITDASPFRFCTADDVAGQSDPAHGIVNYPGTEGEPWVEADPADPRNLIVGWQQDRWSDGGARGNVAAFSRDGGATWRITAVPRASACTGGAYQRGSHPWIGISPDGTAYYMSTAFDPDRPSGAFGRSAILVNRSVDGGRTWGNPIVLRQDPAGQALNDKGSLTADPTDPAYVYAVWNRLIEFTRPSVSTGRAALAASTRSHGMDGVALLRERTRQLKSQVGKEPVPFIFFRGPTWLARTTNGGRSWERARVIFDPGDNQQTINNIVAVLPKGTVVHFFTAILADGSLRIGLIRSFDQGRTFERRPTYVATISPSFSGTITPDAQASVRDSSFLFGVAANRRNGGLYVVWQDVRFRSVDEIAFSESRDRGRTWSTPVRINQTPASRIPLRQQAFIPSIKVAANGTLVVTYYDFRRDNDTGELTDHWAVFCRTDCTKRASWRNERRLTAFSFDMLDAPIARGHFLGDYVGLAVARNVAHPVFGVATRSDVTNLYTCRINVGSRP